MTTTMLIVLSGTAACGLFDSDPNDSGPTKPPPETGNLTLVMQVEKVIGQQPTQVTALLSGTFVQGTSTTGNTSFQLTETTTWTPPGPGVLSTQATGLRAGRWRITLQSTTTGPAVCEPVTVPGRFTIDFDGDGVSPPCS